jgi:hypothetical protein
VGNATSLITVNCVDGPRQGLHQIDIDSQRILRPSRRKARTARLPVQRPQHHDLPRRALLRQARRAVADAECVR